MNIKSIGCKIKGNPTMVEGTVYSMLIICSISHFLNDMIQSIIPSIYPIVKDKFDFSFAQIGIITLVFQMKSSILQPFTGLYADKHPRPYALSIGMCFTLVGLLLLAFAENYFLILLAVSVVGLGSSVFHPTASRVVQMASGGKKSLASRICIISWAGTLFSYLPGYSVLIIGKGFASSSFCKRHFLPMKMVCPALKS